MTYYALWLKWGYGKAKTYSESAPEPSIEGHISTLFHREIPLYVEGRPDGAYEFLTGIKLASNPVNGYYNGIGPIYWKPISPADFEKNINGFSEHTKKAIAKQIRKYDRLAHDFYQSEIDKTREKEKQISELNKKADERLKQHRKY